LFLRASHFSLLLIPLMFQHKIFQFLFIFEVGGGRWEVHCYQNNIREP
jgi:hypothetical protein